MSSIRHHGLIAVAVLIVTVGTASADRRVQQLDENVAACHRDIPLTLAKSVAPPRQDDPGPTHIPLAEVIDIGRGACRALPYGAPIDDQTPVWQRPVPLNQRPLLVTRFVALVHF